MKEKFTYMTEKEYQKFLAVMARVRKEARESGDTARVQSAQLAVDIAEAVRNGDK